MNTYYGPGIKLRSLSLLFIYPPNPMETGSIKVSTSLKG